MKGKDLRARRADSSAPRASLLASGIAGDVYRALRGDILSGRLAPGLRLRFETLTRERHASVGTIREALMALLSDGLVRSDAGRGFWVSPVSLQDARDIERLRLNLELAALTDSIRHGGESWEIELLSAYHRVSKIEERDRLDLLDDEWDARHRSFHFALLAGCTSPWTLHFCHVLFDQAFRYRQLAMPLDATPRFKLQEHRQMMEAALARDVEEAANVMAAHIRSTLMTLLARAPTIFGEDDGRPAQ